jgi:hypothetical protein
VPALLAILLSVSAPTVEPFEHAPETRAFHYSAYEESTIADALAQLRLERAVVSEGSVVEAVDVVRLEVISAGDPAPHFLNWFHVVTWDYVVERELLLRQGDVYRQSLADETRRKLASLPQLSVALVVPARGSDAGRTRLVVITKDVWSLRLNWDVGLTSSGLERVVLNPSETNLFGTHQTAGLLFSSLPASYAFGANYGVPNALGTHVASVVEGGATFSRATGQREGWFGNAQVVSPLWSSRTEWAWGASVAAVNEITRLYSGAQVANFAVAPGTSCPSPSCLPWLWRTRTETASVFVTRSYDWATKHDVSVGFDASSARYTVPDTAGFDPATVAAFEREQVPVGDDRVGPWIQYRTRSMDFLRVLDLETFALQEDYRLGPQARLTVHPILRALGSTRDLFEISAGAAYTAALRDGLASVALDSTNAFRVSSGDVQDGFIRAAVRLATPRMRLGRLVVDALLLDRYANYLNLQSVLGGESRLRGYPTDWLVGSRLLATNVEARSRPVQVLQTIQLGGVLFYDVGDAFGRWDELHLRQSVGVGARVLLPQLDRTVFRVDVGFPLVRDPGVAPANFIVTFGQALSP